MDGEEIRRCMMKYIDAIFENNNNEVLKKVFCISSFIAHKHNI